MPTSDDNNFLIRSLFCSFLDSMERSLSLESNHMPEDGIWCSMISEKFIIALSTLITRKKKKKTPGNLGCHKYTSDPAHEVDWG